MHAFPLIAVKSEAADIDHVPAVFPQRYILSLPDVGTLAMSHSSVLFFVLSRSCGLGSFSFSVTMMFQTSCFILSKF